MGCAHGLIATRSHGETAAGTRSPRGHIVPAASSSASCGGCAPGPGAHSGAPPVPPAPGRLRRPSQKLCARLRGRWPRFFAHSASPPAPGPLPLRGSAPARRARALLRPLRPGPPAPPLGPCAPLCGSVGSRCRRSPAAPSAPLRPPYSVGLAPAPGRRWASRRPAGPPRGLAPSGGFGGFPRPPASAPRSGPGACAALWAALWARCAPGPLAARPRLRGLAGCLSGGAAVVVGLSPAPPRPAAPAGGSGGREARWVASPPAQRVGLLPPLWRAPPGVRPPGLTVRKLSTGFRPTVRAGIFPPPRRRASHCPGSVKAKPSGRTVRRMVRP